MDKDIHKRIQNKIPLKGFSTFKIGGDATYFFTLDNKEDLKDIVSFVKDNSLPLFLLGGGSNVLFKDEGFEGFVLQIRHKGIEIKKEGGEVFVTAEAGEMWDDFVAYTLDNNFFGLENLTAIPGSVGASVVQNIGAYGIEVKDFVESVEIFDMRNLEFRNLNNLECGFGYRQSIFKTEEGKNFIVTSVVFKLKINSKINISYKDVALYFKDKQNPHPKDVRDALIKIRSNKFPDLNVYGTAGSFFKNIICKKEDVSNLQNIYPDMPVYDVDQDMVKVSTAFVLDKVCGLKNFRVGDVGLYENQTLVVVNYGNATANDVLTFVEGVKRTVKEKTGINIEEEVVLA